jgi:very-short-patch-repair endonuclease
MEAIEFARTLRQAPTAAEKKVWRWLRHRQLRRFKFRRQHPVGPYVLDFYCPELRLCIEVDGAVHDYRYAKDVVRTQFLEELGITVLRLTNEYVRKQPDGRGKASRQRSKN